jgi:uncharacterized membrane protein YqjE
MHARREYTLFDRLLIVGAPLLLAVVEVFHPQPHELLNLDVHTWLAVHYAQVALFPLAALAVAWLVRDRAGIAASICRVAMFVFAAAWTAWDAVAGVATGILVDAAHKSPAVDVWRAPIDAIWTHPVMGGMPGTGPNFAVLGAVALSVGAIAAGVTLKRAGYSWLPVAVLVASSFGITIFQTHAWPGGPVTFGGFALASAWLLRESRLEAVPDPRPFA